MGWDISADLFFYYVCEISLLELQKKIADLPEQPYYCTTLSDYYETLDSEDQDSEDQDSEDQDEDPDVTEYLQRKKMQDAQVVKKYYIGYRLGVSSYKASEDVTQNFPADDIAALGKALGRGPDTVKMTAHLGMST